MNESQPRRAAKKIERPRPLTIQPPEEDQFPQTSVEQLAARTETERRQQEWQATKNFVLLQSEANRILDGLNTIASIESGGAVDASKLKSPGFKQAQATLSEWQAIFPKKTLLELTGDIQRRIQNNLGAEVANLTAAGIEPPTGVKFEALEDYFSTLPVAEQLLVGLEASMKENPPASPERARAQRYLVNQGLSTPQEGIRHVTEIMKAKVAILRRLGIELP